METTRNRKSSEKNTDSVEEASIKTGKIGAVIKSIRRHPLIKTLLVSVALHAGLNPDVRKLPADLVHEIMSSEPDTAAKKSNVEGGPKEELENSAKDKQEQSEQKAQKYFEGQEIGGEDEGFIFVQTPEEAEAMLNKVDDRLARIDPEKLKYYKQKTLERLRRSENISLIPNRSFLLCTLLKFSFWP